MSAIKITWLSDSYDCDTCGPSYSEGARVEIDGETALSLTPSAHCYDGTDYSPSDVYAAILAHLGHTVEEEQT